MITTDNFEFRNAPIPGGPFELLETYFYHDGLRAFSMRSIIEDKDDDNREMVTYIGNAVDETPEGDVTYLFAALDEQDFQNIHNGVVPLVDAYTALSTDGLLRVVSVGHGLWGFGRSFTVKTVKMKELPENWLPTSEVTLSTP